MPKTKHDENGDLEDVTAHLEDIKRLLVLTLLKIGASQEEVGKALGVNQSTVSRMVPGVKTTRKRPE